jgi:WD40 repeat protein
VAFGSAGILAAGFAAGTGGGICLFDSQGERLRLRSNPIVVEAGAVVSVAFGPEAILAAGYSADEGDGIFLFDSQGERLWADPIMISEGKLQSVAFGPNGTIAARYLNAGRADGDAGEFGGVVLFNNQGKRLRLQANPIDVKTGAVNNVAFSPEGILAAGYSAGKGGGILLFDERGNQLKVRSNPIATTAIAKFLAWCKGEARLLSNPIEVDEGNVTNVAFGPQGRIAARYGNDIAAEHGNDFRSGVVLFDSDGNRLRPDPIELEVGNLSSMVFSPGGTIATGHFRVDDVIDDGSPAAEQKQLAGGVVLIDGDPASWRAKLEKVINRNFNLAEWQRFFPDTPYRRTIPWLRDVPDSERKRLNGGKKE